MKNLFLIFLFIPAFLFSQGWEKTYGDNGNGYDVGYSVQQTNDGGYIVTGLTDSFGNGAIDVYLIKTDNAGDTLWTKTFGVDENDGGYSVQQTTDGGYIISGYFSRVTGGVDGDVYLIKTNNAGDTLWTKTFGGSGYDYGWSVKQTTDSGYIISGTTDSYGHGSCDIYLIKTDNAGDTLWTKTFGGDEYDGGNSVQQTTDGGYIIIGYTRSFGNGGMDVYLIKTDNAGDKLWTRTFGGVHNDGGISVQQTTDGGYIISGFTVSFGMGGNDIYLIKTDSNGDALWTKTFGGVHDDVGNSVQQTTDGGYIIAGSTDKSNNGWSLVYLIKTNNAGDTIWTKSYGSGWGACHGYSVQQTTDGGYILTGSYVSYDISAYEDVYLIKTDENGIVLSTIEIPIPNSDRKLVKIVDLSGKVISKPEKNQPYIEIYNDGTTLKKMNIK